ncbi:hypothetical protein [Novosphingobium aquimarinum]|nr:hypothetical protein [Novosphingobium aquimarinum]
MLRSKQSRLHWPQVKNVMLLAGGSGSIGAAIACGAGGSNL